MSGFSGKYRLDARLGGGGMAEVFLGSTVGAEGFSRRVAIKRVLPGFSDDPAFARMFIDEARISSRLVHPNIVSVIDFDRDPEGRLYLVMELVDGKDLDALASTGPLPVPVVVFVISEVLRGLGHAHDLPVAEDASQMRGIVHRDVSPHNVLLSWEGSIKVSDFGIAKARTASSATASELVKGKPAYMSPEQANGESLDGRSDLFAVGVMLWELLVGRRLFVGGDTRATLAAVLFGQIPRPRSLRSDVPKDLERVVMKLLERDRPGRYATAEAAIRDLLECDAAPKDGRELLKRTLQARFPQDAPVRHSVLRSRGTPPQVTPTGSQEGNDVPIHDRQTIASPTPAAALPSIGEQRGAPTSTMRPTAHLGPAAMPIPPRRKGKAVIVLTTSIAAAVVGVGVIAAVARDEREPRAAGSAAGSQSAPVGATPTLDAGATEAPPGAVAAAPDAGVAGSTKKDATAARPSEKRMGRLQVRAFPVLTVYIDNKKIRDTPLDMQLAVGKHKLRLVNSELGKDESLTVTIEENKPTIIDRN